MKMEPLKGGRLKIWMTHRDMLHWGLRFETMDAQDTFTQQAMLRLLTVARERAALIPCEELTVEAIPFNHGCLLLVTPAGCLPPFCGSEPLIYTFRTADDLLGFGKSLRSLPCDTRPASSLFSWNGEYRLIVYPLEAVTPACKRLLREFAELTTQGRVAAAYTEEHGTALLIGDALQRLCR